jgi:hypothetical protein
MQAVEYYDANFGGSKDYIGRPTKEKEQLWKDFLTGRYSALVFPLATHSLLIMRSTPSWGCRGTYGDDVPAPQITPA